MNAGSAIKMWNDALVQGAALIGKDRPGPGVLEVIGGLHTGAKADLEERSYTIGSSIESDIVLRDRDIAPIHVRLHRRRGFVEVEAVGGDITISEGHRVPQGHGRRCTLPFEASLGQAQLRLSGPAELETQPQKNSARPPWLLPAGLVSAAIAVMLGLNTLSMATPDKSDQDAFAALDDHSTGTLPAQARAQAMQAGDELRQELQNAGLHELRVSQNAGRLLVSGSIAERQGRSWMEIQSWFDRNYGGGILLASDVTVGQAIVAPRLVLQAIWYGEKPYVIAADGARYHEGAFTDDGWMVAAIGEEELLLTKDGARVALKYP